MATIRSVQEAPTAPDRPLSPVRRWSSRVGAIALVGLGIAHTVVNARGYAAQRDTSLLVFLVFAPGVSLLLLGIAAAARRHGSRVTSGAAGAAIRAVVALGALLLCATAVNLLLNHPAVVWIPLGPGPWSVIGGPALALAAIAPSAVPRTTDRGGSAGG